MPQSFLSPSFAPNDLARLLSQTNIQPGPMHGVWFMNGRADLPCHIWHGSGPLGIMVIENEQCDRVAAQLIQNVLTVPHWGNLQGLYIDAYRAIFWANGSYWTRDPRQPGLQY